MNREISEEVLAVMAEVYEKLNGSLYRVRVTCPEDEYKKYQEEISKLMSDMYFGVMRPIHDAHPELEPEALKQRRLPQ